MARIGGWELELEAEPGSLVGHIAPGDARDELYPRVRNPGGAPVRIDVVRFSAALDEPAPGAFVWLHGGTMQQDTLGRLLGTPLEPGYRDDYVAVTPSGRRYRSRSLVTLTLGHRAPPVLLLGALELGEVALDFELSVSGADERLCRLGLCFALEGRELGPGETLELPALLGLGGDDPWSLAARWAERVARRMAARVPPRPPTGWCSWTACYGQVSEAAVIHSVQAMARERWPLDVVQIDDGYQSATGDWLEPNARFPGGMKRLGASIRAAGFVPGLWLAPLLLHEHSAALRARPELALRTADGALALCDSWLGRCAVLDCTSRAGERWLQELVATCTGEWGYRYLKLDALAFAAVPGDRAAYAARPTTGLGHVRRALEIIRRAAGDDVFLLGCTCPFGSAIGLVDGMRVGADVKAVWNAGPHASVRHAMRSSLQRGFLHGRWWSNDPDCLLLRSEPGGLDAAELRFLGTAVAMSGGAVLVGEPMGALSLGERQLGLPLMPPLGVAARPLDQPSGAVASLWRCELGEGRAALGILNWGDAPRPIDPSALLPAGGAAFDVWRGRMVDGPLELAPHDGALWQLSPASSEPTLVGDSGHLGFRGLGLERQAGALELRNELDRARVVAVRVDGSVTLVGLGARERRALG